MYSDLNKYQVTLHDLMSGISEEAWCAGWMDGLEYVLWYIMLHGPAKYGMKFIDEQTIEKLKQLSQQAEAWVVYDDMTQETAITLSEWETVFRSVDSIKYLKYIK